MIFSTYSEQINTPLMPFTFFFIINISIIVNRLTIDLKNGATEYQLCISFIYKQDHKEIFFIIKRSLTRSNILVLLLNGLMILSG